MRRWLRSPTFLKLLVGQHILNGLSVAAGVMIVAIAASALWGFGAGQPATLGAIAASISDFPAPWRIKARRMATGFTLALLSTSAIQLAPAAALAQIPAIGAIAFVAGMVTGYGRWALALSMQTLIPMVFVMGLPRADFAGALHNEALLAAGGFAYIAIALLATGLTDASGRRLMASECFREFGAYLRAFARFYDADFDAPEVYGGVIRQQAALSEQLQAARALLLDHPLGNRERLRLAATIGILLDAFDALVAAQVALEDLRREPETQTLMARAGVALRAAALDLQHLSLELLATPQPKLPADHALAIDALRREAGKIGENRALSPAAQASATLTARRLGDALGNIRRLELALCDDGAAAAAISGVDLSTFWPRNSLALRLLGAHLTIASPVFRYAVRLALAMMAGGLAAASLSGDQHSNWVLLTIAVILRANYGLTRQRRDDRVLGTLIGCAIAAAAVAYAPLGWLVVVQGLALALTHGYARLNYRLSSIGASIVALVSLHLIDPAEAAPVATRLADTLVGAAIAHLFSYFLPRWEIDEAPRIAAGLQGELAKYAFAALREGALEHDYRLARKSAIEAIAALSDSAARMGGEPKSVQRGLDELAAMLIAAMGLAANISATRLSLRDASASPLREDVRAAREWLAATLSGAEPGAASSQDAPLPQLRQAALRLVAASRAYALAAAAPVRS